MTTITTDRLTELQAVNAEVEGCTKCEIAKTRRKTVFSDGNPSARLMIVGEGPGEHEDRTGVPFVGPAGDLLNRMLSAIGLDRSKDVYICNVIKCRASETIDGRMKNRPPRIDETQNCSGYLSAQIRLVQPEVILGVGAPAAKALVDPRFAITSGRGRWYDGPQGVPIMITFHPAYLLRLSGDAEQNAKRLVWQDLKAVRARLDGRRSEVEKSTPGAPIAKTQQPGQPTLFR